MTGFNHALTGATIGIAVQQPLLIIPIALASHFLLDVTPHFGGHPVYEWGHKHFLKVIALDAVMTIGAVIAALLIAPQFAFAIVLGVICAMLPDVSLIHYYTHGKPKHWFHDFHLGIQWFERPPGILVEASYFIFIVTTLIAIA